MVFFFFVPSPLTSCFQRLSSTYRSCQGMLASREKHKSNPDAIPWFLISEENKCVFELVLAREERDERGSLPKGQKLRRATVLWVTCTFL